MRKSLVEMVCVLCKLVKYEGEFSWANQWQVPEKRTCKACVKANRLANKKDLNKILYRRSLLLR